MNCKNCGKELGSNEKYCLNCGVCNEPKNKISIVIIIITIFIMLIISITIFLLITRFIKNQSFIDFTDNNTQTVHEKETKVYMAYPKAKKKYLQLDSNSIEILPEKESEFNQNIKFLNHYMAEGLYADVDTNGNRFGDYFLIHGKNNNSSPVNINVTLDLYDKENYKIKSINTDVYAIKAGKEFVVAIRTELDADLDVYNYKLSYNAKKIDDYYDDLDLTKEDFEINIEKNKNSFLNNFDVNLKIKSKFKDSIYSVNVLINYFREGKIVFTDMINTYDLDPNIEKEKIITLWKLNDESFDYDNYDIEIVSAYQYQSKNW